MPGLRAPVPSVAPEVGEPQGEHVECQFDSEDAGEEAVEGVQRPAGAVGPTVNAGELVGELQLQHVGAEVLAIWKGRNGARHG